MRRTRPFFAALLSCTLLLSGCSLANNSEGSPIAEESAEILGETMTFWAQGERTERKDATSAAVAEAKRLAALFSYNGPGDIAVLNAEGQVEAESDTIALLSRAKEISLVTDGLYSATRAPLLDAWGFTTDEYRVPDESELAALLPLVDDAAIQINGSTITLQKGAKVYVDDIARAYISERVIDIFEGYALERAAIFWPGCENMLTNVSRINSSWPIEIPNPYDSSLNYANYLLYNTALITDGPYKEIFEKNSRIYHAVIDPRTGMQPTPGLLTVSVESEDAVLAAALAQALPLMGHDGAKSYWRSHADEFDAFWMVGDVNGTPTEGVQPSGSNVYVTSGIARQSMAYFSLLDDTGHALTPASEEEPIIIE